MKWIPLIPVLLVMWLAVKLDGGTIMTLAVPIVGIVVVAAIVAAVVNKPTWKAVMVSKRDTEQSRSQWNKEFQEKAAKDCKGVAVGVVYICVGSFMFATLGWFGLIVSALVLLFMAGCKPGLR